MNNPGTYPHKNVPAFRLNKYWDIGFCAGKQECARRSRLRASNEQASPVLLHDSSARAPSTDPLADIPSFSETEMTTMSALNRYEERRRIALEQAAAAIFSDSDEETAVQFANRVVKMAELFQKFLSSGSRS